MKILVAFLLAVLFFVAAFMACFFFLEDANHVLIMTYGSVVGATGSLILGVIK